MVRLGLIFEAARRGLRLRIDHERLVVRGPRREEPLAREILERKGEVMALLQAHPELAALDSFTAEVTIAFDGEVIPDGEGPVWGDCVPLDWALDGSSATERRGERP